MRRGIAHFETEQGLVGGSAYDAHKVSISEGDMEKAKSADAIIFGAVGGPKWDAVPYEARPEAGLLRLRKDLGLFANLRPAVCYPALADASSLKREAVEGLDIMIVRELTGGVYFGEPKTITDLGNGQKRAIDTQVYDTYEIERIGRVAFDLARKRRNKVTSMEKRNVMKSGVLWNEVMTQVHAREYKDVTLEHQLADSGGMMLVKAPKQFDVIVTDNLFGDMLSDIAAMLTGSLGMLPSASLGEIDCQDEEAPLAVRAGARLGARHRRQGPRQSDRDDRLIRHGAALFLRHGRARRQGRFCDRRGARQRPAHRRHQVGGHDVSQHHADGRGDPERAAEAARLNKRSPARAGLLRKMRTPQSIQREALRIAAEILRRIERLTIDRTVAVLARERGITNLRRECVVLEFAVARQHLGAGIEPGARGDVDARVALLDDAVRTARPVSDAAVPVVFHLGLLRARRRNGHREDGNCRKQH